MKQFIKYLDLHTSNSSLSNSDYLYMIHSINMNYLSYNIGQAPVYSPYPFHMDNSQEDGKIPSYLEWQHIHEAIIQMDENLTYNNHLVIPKEKKHIDANIQSIDDILAIIEANPYDPIYDYNIDLKSLHAIKDELTEINQMVGLDAFKTSILEQLLYFIQNLHIGTDSDFKHTVLSGPPGTGKTEIAKLLGTMYSKIGLLKNNVFQKVTRSDLIAGYLGQTAMKTQKVIEKSLGGVLFIDEAYSLAEPSQNDSFSKECIDTLCEALSDHKTDLMVIIAGYEEELNETFFKVNRGLHSRFIWRFKMEPYSPTEMKLIFMKKVQSNEWNFENPAEITDKWFEKNKASFKNHGRDMDLLFTYTKIAHGRRIYGKPVECRKKISMDDLEKGYLVFVKNNIKKEENTFISDMYV